MKKTNRTKEITFVGLMAALCVASRWYLQFLPNIKPVTAIVILVSLFVGLNYGIELAIVQTLISNLLLGMGTWTVFQITAWVIISILTFILKPALKRFGLPAIALFAAMTGFIFGFIVSFERLLYVNWQGFILYYIAGLPFDCLHAFGNLVFIAVLYVPFQRVLKLVHLDEK